MARTLNLIVDVQGGKLISSFNSTTQGQAPSFVFGDSTPVSVRLVEPTGITDRPWREIDLTDQAVWIGLGVTGGRPSDGTFTLTYGADTTSALVYNASAAVVETALNLLASIISAGGVTVTSGGTNTYKIRFTSVGTRTDFTATTDTLSPASSALVSTVTAGTVSVRGVYMIKVETDPAALIELEDDFPVAAVTIETTRAGASGVSEIQTISFDPVPYNGTYTLTVGANETSSLDYNATAAQIQAALVLLASVGTGNATVTGEFPSYTVTYAASLGNIAQATATTSNLIVPAGRSGTLSTNTTGVQELLASRSRLDVTLEVQLLSGSSEAWTALQVTCPLIEDVIPNTPPTITPMPAYLLEATASAIYQTLTNEKTSNYTAANDSVNIVTATATVTDPSPVQGKGHITIVRNGTATVGGVAYTLAGTIIHRTYHSGAWASKVYKDIVNTPQTLTDAATIAFDYSLGKNAKVTVAGNRTLGAISGLVAGDEGTLTFIQDATGGRSLTLNAQQRDVRGNLANLTALGANGYSSIKFYTHNGTNVDLYIE